MKYTAPRWLRTSEAAELLAVSSSTLEKWRTRGEGPPYYRVGGSIKYDRAEVLAWLEERKRR